jgi:ferredoxin
MRLVTHEIEIVEANCTGCYRCERACPTNAITMVGPKQSALAVVDNDSCIACSRCIDSCDDDAMLARERDEPMLVQTEVEPALEADVAGLCRSAGLDPELSVCLCSQTQAQEVAAAVLGGAATFTDLALATGAQSGCLLYCSVPMRRLLTAYLGHEPDEGASKLRRYPPAQGVLELSAEVAARYPTFHIAQEQAAARTRLAELEEF